MVNYLRTNLSSVIENYNLHIVYFKKIVKEFGFLKGRSYKILKIDCNIFQFHWSGLISVEINKNIISFADKKKDCGGVFYSVME